MEKPRIGKAAAWFPAGYVERAAFYRLAYRVTLRSSRVRALFLEALPPSRFRSAFVGRILHCLFEDWSDEKLDRVLSVIHPDRGQLELPGALGTYTGKDAVRRGWDAIQDAFPGARLKVREWIDGRGNALVVCLATDMKGGSSGISIGEDLFGVWDYSEGFGTRLRIFTSKAEALEAVGLSE